MKREGKSCSQIVVSAEQSPSNREGASGAIYPGGRKMDHRPFGGPGAKRSGSLARDDGRDS